MAFCRMLSAAVWSLASDTPHEGQSCRRSGKSLETRSPQTEQSCEVRFGSNSRVSNCPRSLKRNNPGLPPCFTRRMNPVKASSGRVRVPLCSCAEMSYMSGISRRHHGQVLELVVAGKRLSGLATAVDAVFQRGAKENALILDQCRQPVALQSQWHGPNFRHQAHGRMLQVSLKNVHRGCRPRLCTKVKVLRYCHFTFPAFAAKMTSRSGGHPIF